jgi:bifunctional UDP-N-acetylglucosamine pyrophosphorylase/glucosamine-1-phosphate N-acetyltransferase
MTVTALILAAGKGTRMNSNTAKVLHPVGGRPMLDYVVRSARQVSDNVHAVVGHQSEAVRGAVDGIGFIDQSEQLGTGHAVMAARDFLRGSGAVLVLPGDVPLVRGETLQAFIDFHRDGGFSGSVLTASVDDATGYGRVVRDDQGRVSGIVEHRDADTRVLEIREINSSIYVFDCKRLFDALERIRPDNAQGEYYLTDVVGVFVEGGSRFGAFQVDDATEILGINSLEELARVDRLIRGREPDSGNGASDGVQSPAAEESASRSVSG